MATLKSLMATLSREGLQEQRAEIIYHFTGGRTCSARELTVKEITALKNAISQTPLGPSKELDKKRKRLLASIFGVFKLMNKQPSMDYVKAMACRAAKVKDFNKIPSERLNSLYNAFLNAQKDINFARRLVGNIEIDLMDLN